MANAYTYKAGLICEDCADNIKRTLTSFGKAPENPDDESSYDSDEWPKGPYSNGGGEADSPQHCDMMDHCINADWCPAHGKHLIGMFLENPLTTDGYKYVEETCKESLAGAGGCVSLDIWAPFYQISLEDDDSLPAGE